MWGSIRTEYTVAKPYQLSSALLQIILSSMVLERKPWSRPMLQLPRLHQSYAGVTFQTNSLPSPTNSPCTNHCNLISSPIVALSLYISLLYQEFNHVFPLSVLTGSFKHFGVFFFSITPWLRGPGDIYRRINPGKNRHHPFIIHGYVRTSLF